MFYMHYVYMEINSHSYIWNAEVNEDLIVTVHSLSAKHSLKKEHIKYAEQNVQFLLICLYFVSCWPGFILKLKGLGLNVEEILTMRTFVHLSLSGQ